MRFVLAPRRRRVVRMPVALYWRRKRKAPMQHRALRPAIAAAVSNHWLAHFHLHCSAIARERGRREESRSSLPGIVTREIRRLVTSRHWTTVRAVALSYGAGFPPTDRSASRPAIPAPLAPRTLPGGMRAGRAPDVAITPRATDRRVRPLFDRTTRNVFRTVVSKSELTQQIERETSIVSREQRLMHSRTSSTRRLQETSIVRIHRPPEIVWRTAAQPNTNAQIINESPLPIPRLSRPPAATPEAAKEIPHRAALAVLQASDLDPALLDRLTDDVIRRVERRVRIDRERRGL